MDPRSKASYAIIFALAFLPALYSLLLLDSSFQFDGLSSAMRSIGKILGLAGLVLFSVTLLLNTRIRLVEEMFFGLDRTFRAHHVLGTVSFVFVLFHPIFLSAQFLAFSIKAAASLFIPFVNTAVTFGIFALLTMVIFLAITFLAKWKYQKWRFSHQLLGISFILAAIHVLLIQSDVAQDLFLRSYMALFITIGIASYAYRTILWKKLVRRHDYVLKKARDLGGITELTLEPLSRPVSFSPGQFAFISFGDEKMKEPHPFTISSSCFNKELVFSAKDLGDYTGMLGGLAEGTKVKVEGAYGRFSIAYRPSRRYVFIAGGIGITPFLSMLRSIRDSPESFGFESIDLYYSVKKKEEAVFLSELNSIAESAKNRRITVFLHESEQKGHLSQKHIMESSKEIREAHVFICGPPAMMYSLRDQLVSAGLDRRRIYLEEFALL